MRFHSYFNTAIRIIQSYDGSIPLSHFLKQYFSGNKKHGSKDRKFITHACYSYFRLGHALENLQIEERLKAAIFLCNENAEGWSLLYDEDWLKNWSNSLDERISFIKSTHSSFSLDDVFRFTSELSEDIETTSFVQSHLVQPDVFLRIRPHCREQVLETLRQNAIPFTLEGDDCIRVRPNINVEKFLKLDKEVVVQDASSQQLKKYLEPVQPKILIRNPKS
jgi:16S rRNA (cytosine967-C5)-methyltransferase